MYVLYIVGWGEWGGGGVFNLYEVIHMYDLYIVGGV